MRDPKRIHNIMVMVETLWKMNPDMRFFQLVEWISNVTDANNSFYVEDDKVLDTIEMMIMADTQGERGVS